MMMFDDSVAWYSDMAARHPALPPEQQRRMLWSLMVNVVRLQCWQGQPWSEYLRQCRQTLAACRAGSAPIWQTGQDSYAWWLQQTGTASPAGLNRRRDLVRSLRDRLLLHNQRMVIRIAHRKLPRGLDYGDLVMEGNLGLIRAVDLFDPRKNYRFSTYAHFWIEQAITLAIKQKGHTVRTPLSALNKAWKEQKEHREREIEMNRDRPQSGPAWGGFSETLSLDDPDVSLHLSDEQSTQPQAQLDAQRLVAQLTRNLPERLHQVLALRYGIEQRDAVGYREIADQLGISRERARQLEQEALRMVRKDQEPPQTSDH